MQFGVADYGMTVWDGGLFDAEARWESLREIGYDGVERLLATSADEALMKAARMRRVGMDFATCLGPNVETSLHWTVALGKSYLWTNVSGGQFEVYCRQVNTHVAHAALGRARRLA